ncbi:Mu DNA binding I gamma subdomain [Xanthobacter versatilis]|uniref:Mu DNA binding I gamma subdomain n=1 Tax=Xanthobacter autotrophicus (strain ATCC BAA-1158 / Py2) TaxID=78245 RepID=A7IP00_XANP2|nr:Mu DNA binding I gamma subdomain [Xanthobacter autotrophicus Py2]
MREWWTAAEFADLGLPDVPTAKKAVLAMIERVGGNAPDRQFTTENPLGIWRRRQGRGGGREYRMDVLPGAAKAALALRLKRAAAPETPQEAEGAALALRDSAELWAWFDALPQKRKDEAKRRLDALLAVEELQKAGRPRDHALMDMASRIDVSLRTLYGWSHLVGGLDRADWLPALAPRHIGRVAEAEIPAEMWATFVSDYLRDSKPTIAACFRRTESAAQAAGLAIPSMKTFQRRVEAMPKTTVVLAREGVDGLKKLYPAQERDRSSFHALEAVNADGHVWDVFVKWLDGTVSRPVLIGFQDLYSGMILSWRIARTSDAATVLLAFGDLVETYGIPEHCWLDNGREFASKWFTGRQANRYRFKVKEEDPAGVLTQLGVQVHWTKPYSGQSKPIERAWRDFAGEIAKHPAFDGAYAGNSPDAKPESYGSKAVPIETFEKVVAAEIAAHNARAGRRSSVCGGRLSFQQAFAASYADAIIRKAAPAQSRLWLLACEGVKVRSDASVHLEGNRYWDEKLTDMVGHKVILRFDPADLHAGVCVYRLDGAHVVDAPAIDKSGFRDVAEASAHGRARGAFLKAQRTLLDAVRTMSPDEVAAMSMQAEVPEALPEPRAIRPIFGGAAALALQLEREPDQDVEPDAFSRGVGRLRLVTNNAADD